MKAVIQRVKYTRLSVDGKVISEIGKGLTVYFGVEIGDDPSLCEYFAKKIANMRIFEDENGKMNLSIKDVKGDVLFVSQFTLLADCSHGNRPGFSFAEKPERADELYRKCGELIKQEGVPVKYGVFGADMQIDQMNDGPVTIILEKK